MNHDSIAGEGVPRVDVMLACRLRDMPTLRLAIAGLRRYCPVRDIIVAVRSAEMAPMQRGLGATAEVRDENAMIPGMTIAELGRLPISGFPRGAGWYFQQMLKYAFCFERPADDWYLIWDADTIPLRPMEFFDAQGRLIFTRSDEHHPAYFDTYERLFGSWAPHEYSFISQHMPVRKSRLREMLARIEARLPGGDNWAWKIMRTLPGEGINLFSEYETYGHYMKQWHADEIVVRSLPWLREGTRACGFRPRRACLERLGDKYFFAAFEAGHHWPVRLKRAVARLLGR